MAQSGPGISARVVILFVLVVHLCPSMRMKIPDLCSNIYTWPSQYCSHNQSGMCGFSNGPVSCIHQLQQKEVISDMTAAECQMEEFGEASDCGSLEPTQIYTHEKPLVGLSLYHYSTWIGKQSAVNFTFPSPDWRSLKFQYKVNNSQQGTFCRHFSLQGVNLPLNGTLMFDCVVFRVAGDVARDAEVTVANDRGEGRTFIFRVPSHSRINPMSTSLSEWHVFFYLHQDFIATSSHLPVTVQSAVPFREVSYKVSIVKCLDANSPDCGNYATLNSTLVANPTKDEWTVHLPIWSNPGSYAVTVQIVSEQCPSETGCYVSVSPKFDILRALQEVQPSVLLVYLAENQPYLEFINIFADFLKNTCRLLPYLVDRDVGIQDPNCWTRDHIIRADKVLFIVPGNPDGESITPIRNQWIVALNYISGHHFTTLQMTRKVAAVILPVCGSIPCEILHVHRFKLVDQIAALVTWLHNGTWLDEIFLWQPKIRSSSQERVSYSWSEMRDAALRVSSLTGRTSETRAGISVMYGNIFLTSTNDQITALRDDISIQSEDSATIDGNSEASSFVFDPDIPSLNRLQREEKCSSVCSQDSDNLLDSGDDGIFT